MNDPNPTISILYYHNDSIWMDKKFIESLAFMNHMKHKADHYETANRDLKSAELKNYGSIKRSQMPGGHPTYVPTNVHKSNRFY